MRIVLAMLAVLGFVGAGAAQEFALDAPGAVGMRDSVPVTWTAPAAKGGLLEIRPTGENARRASYAYLTKNPQTIEAPEAPGDYVIVLVFEREDRVSRPLRVDPATATLEASATSDAGADMVVT